MAENARLPILLAIRLGVCIGPMLMLPGCVEGFDSANGSDKAYYRLYDYHIDRPRVLGMTYWPLLFSGGDIVTFEALAAAPDQLIDAEVEWWSCGIDQTVPFTYYSASCLNSSAAVFLGSGKTLEVEMPAYDTSSCESTGCYGFFPMIAVLGSDVPEPDEGYGITWLAPDYLNQSPPVYFDLHFASLTFKVGEGETTTTTARPGDRIRLEAELETYDVDFLFSWYASAGTFERLGLTRASSAALFSPPRRNVIGSENVLLIPEDQPAGPLMVYLVIDTVSYYYPGLQRFAVGRIEVSP